MSSKHIVVVLIIAASAANACKGSKAVANSSQAQQIINNVPVISYAQDTIHLGTLIEGEKKQLTYHFTNTGTETLVIDLATACRCTDLSWPQDPIEPGQTGEITVEFDSTGFSGDVVKTIDVIANTEPIVKLAWFTAHIEKK